MLKFIMYRDTEKGRQAGNKPIAIVIAKNIDDAFKRLRAEAKKDIMRNVVPTPTDVRINGYKVGRTSKIPYYYTLKAYCDIKRDSDFTAIYKILAYDKTPDGKEII